MSAAKKTNYSDEFKFRVALDAARGNKTIQALVAEYNVASCLISKWKKQLLDSGSQVFNSPNKKSKTVDAKENNLYEQLGRQAMELEYLKKFAGKYQ